MIFGPHFPVPYHVSPPLMSRTARNYKFYGSLKICHEKSRPQRFFALYDFPLLLCFSHLPAEGASEFNKFCEIAKIGATTTIFTLLFFVTFWFVSLTRGASEFNKFCENGKKSGPQRFFVPFLFFSLTRRRFRIQQIL